MEVGPERILRVCQGVNCHSLKSAGILTALRQEVEFAQLTDIRVETAGCHGFCQEGPTVIVEPVGIFYTHVQTADAREIVQSQLIEGKPVERLLYRDPVTGETIARYKDIPFFSNQHRITLRKCGHIDPERIEDSLATGGYTALKKALLEMTPDQVIAEVGRAGLRGRGGAGFPTGRKWEVCRQAPGTKKYVICNDRNTMEGDPHTLIEGIIIAAYAVGASEGYVVFRSRSPLALKRMATAIGQAKEKGFLGKDILGTGFSFQLHLLEGSEDFVCGEETALIATLEGKKGMPRPRPPYPAESGLWGRPTVVNNAKTFATIPAIITKGAVWYAGLGTEGSKGTAIFVLTGKVANKGVVEIPLNMTWRELVYTIGGGVPRGKRLKALHVGGPTGGFVPLSHLDYPVDYETVSEVGSLMGAAVVTVLDEDNCIVDTTKSFLAFSHSESCGKCISCRWGLKQLLDIMDDITGGKGKFADLDLLAEVGRVLQKSAFCNLGRTAPNPVLSSLDYFQEEYETHVKKARCPAAVCKELVEAPCIHTCPAGVNIPRYLRLIAQERYDHAYAVIRERIPFPAVCGYVCFHPCETKCRRSEIDQPVAIRDLKRFAADHIQGVALSSTPAVPPSGKRVAVIGAGPAGLTAAYYLARCGGHTVTVFEALPQPGGMMLVGIPRYRLPLDVLEKEINIIREAGVEIRTNSPIDSVDSLFDKGYDAVFVAPGAHAPQGLRIPGEKTPGVIDSIVLLRDVSLGRKVQIGRRVAVIGGGNVAMDAARTALRLRARDVTVLYRRSREEMPASPEEIEEALQEGVKMEFLVAPTRITAIDGQLELTSVQMRLGKLDESGRRRPEPIPGSEFTRRYDTIIAAIGQAPSIPPELGLAVTKGGTIIVDPDTLATGRPGVFAGGDGVSGPASVIEAIAAGRQAAISIDRYLGGKGIIEETFAPPEAPAQISEIPEEETPHRRPKMVTLPEEIRLRGFELVGLGLQEKEALEEARRCLKCDLEGE